MIRPTQRLVTLVACTALLGAAAVMWPGLGVAWTALCASLVVLGLLDAIALARRPTPTVARTVPETQFLATWHDVTLRIDAPADGRGARLVITDHPPEGQEMQGLPQALTIGPRGFAIVTYRARPERRGSARTGPIEILLEGPLGLVERRVRTVQAQDIRVYPDFRPVAHYALLALDRRRQQMGIHLMRRRGEGLDFLQLREYREGDALRQIDWKAVSRRDQLISREYQDEKDQHVLLLLDCGRRMRTREGSGTGHFDHALNAVLLLSYVALRQGDSVGLMTFGGAERYVPPRKGRGTLGVLLDAVYDLEPTLSPADYGEALERVLARQRRRALVVVVTNLRDDDQRDLVPTLARLRSRHVPLVASLREEELDQTIGQPVTTFDSALRLASTHRYLTARSRAHEDLRRRRVDTLDVTPGDLPAALVNHYLAIKRTGRL